jgi:multiple sugar transport system ATP-binding protein
MTVFENMAFGLKLRKFAKQEVKDMVNEAARILDLEDYLERKPKALSGGQRQRVAVGRAIVRKPAVFLFDEPLSNLDAKLRVQMRTEISKLHNKLKATMIYVTHDQTEAMTMGDKIVLMKDGIVHQDDKPLNLYNNPSNKFVASFIGSPSMNFFVCSVSSNGEAFTSESGKLKFQLNKKQKDALVKYKGKKIIAGIRPEDLHDVMDSNVSNNFVQMDVLLDVVEPMGNEIYLYFNLEGQPFVSRIPAREIPNVFESKKLFINANKLHLFDPSTEVVISQ